MKPLKQQTQNGLTLAAFLVKKKQKVIPITIQKKMAKEPKFLRGDQKK